MKFVVKLGGAGLEDPTLLDGCTRAIAELVRDGNQVAVVHGGGVQLTKTLKALGKQSEFINGLRVTDAETRDVALMVFAGKVNQRLQTCARCGRHDERLAHRYADRSSRATSDVKRHSMSSSTRVLGRS